MAIKKSCAWCGTYFEPAPGTRQIYCCTDCQKMARSARDKEKTKSQRHQSYVYWRLVSRKNPVFPKRCLSCVYASTAGEIPVCDYIGAVGHSRGCPADEKCPRYRPIKGVSPQ